jgi:hypothetical protein
MLTTRLNLVSSLGMTLTILSLPQRVSWIAQDNFAFTNIDL